MATSCRTRLRCVFRQEKNLKALWLRELRQKIQIVRRWRRIHSQLTMFLSLSTPMILTFWGQNQVERRGRRSTLIVDLASEEVTGS